MATMTNLNLPIIQDCNDCGECCRSIGTPPGFALYFPPDGHTIPEWAVDQPDHEHVKAMPTSVRLSLATYYRAVWARQIPDRTASDVPCLWFDESTRKCSHYEHRPQVCREFELGEPACRNFRKSIGLEA